MIASVGTIFFKANVNTTEMLCNLESQGKVTFN